MAEIENNLAYYNMLVGLVKKLQQDRRFDFFISIALVYYALAKSSKVVSRLFESDF